MPRTIAHLIYDFLAPEQPDYCREASLQLLAEALSSTGPVIHAGQVVSVAKDGSVEFDTSRKAEPIPATTEPDDEGNTVEVPERPPTEAELAAQWGLPLAIDTPLPAARYVNPNPAAQEG
jgi:hypothetical protein